jgi:lipase maturation factor 1
MGLIFGSAFYSLLFQIHGLIGERGILPATSYLHAVRDAVPGMSRYWIAPTLFWLSAGDRALGCVVWVGLVASVLLAINVAPRVASILCTIAFLSCIAALQDFASYQSDGMLLQAGVACMCLAPPGMRPGLAASSPPSRAGIWLLRWEWFAIYFESGVVKLLSGDVQWRTLTAMDHYYEDSPLPAWPGWYAQQLPHAFHAGTVLLTFALELVAPWVVFLTRRPRIILAAIVSVFQIGIIVTSNYGFLNVLVLVLGVALVDDRALTGAARWMIDRVPLALRSRGATLRTSLRVDRSLGHRADSPQSPATGRGGSRWNGWIAVVVLAITVYVGVVDFLPFALPGGMRTPARLLAPLRVTNAYGLYAVMTTAEYEIEFQGRGNDTTWVPYPFRYKPQDPGLAPRLYVPYQPRFDWNLWFASLGPWNDSPWVVMTQVQLLTNDPSVLSLFAANPFAAAPPTAVRSVLWRYSFTDVATHRRTGQWWHRELLGLYGGTVTRASGGSVHFEPPNNN